MAPATGDRNLTRAETAADLAGDDLEQDATRSTTEARYREILAELFRPDVLDDLDDSEHEEC